MKFIRFLIASFSGIIHIHDIKLLFNTRTLSTRSVETDHTDSGMSLSLVFARKFHQMKHDLRFCWNGHFLYFSRFLFV